MTTRPGIHRDGAIFEARAFFILAIAMNYAIGLPVAASSHGLLPVDLPVPLASLALFSPAIAALFLSAARGGRADLRRLCQPLLAWRIGASWYAVALLLPVAINAAALILHVVLDGERPPLPAPLPDEFQTAGSTVFVLLPIFLLIGSLGEELGWRGYALPRLQARYTALTTSILIGIVWAVWHLPLFLMAGSAQAEIPVVWYGPYILAASVLFTWIYNATGGSLAAVTVFHAAIQGVNLAIPILPATLGDARGYVLAALVTIAVAAAVISTFGPRSLSRRGRVIRGSIARGPLDADATGR